MIYELLPANGQKSFYGKAKVEVDDNCERLWSYDTLICARDRNTGRLCRLCDDWALTRTTLKHIKAFTGLNKKEFMKC